MDGEDSPRRVLCSWRVHPPASTLPAVARATAGRFVRCEYLIGRDVGVPRGPASGFWVGCSPVRDSLESGGPAALGRQWLRPLTTDRQPCGEQLTLAGPLGTSTPRPIRNSHLTKRPAVARATAGKVLAGGCTRQRQSTRRGLSSPSMRGITSTICGYSIEPRPTWPSFSSSWWVLCGAR